MIWAPNSIDWAVAALAVTYAGGVLVPANSRYTGARGRRHRRAHRRLAGRGRRRLPRPRPRSPICKAASDRRRRAIVTSIHADLDDRSPADSRRRAPTRSRPDDVADILFTSGTTGRSKGAMSAHRQTIGVARAWAELGGVQADDRYLVVNPFFHSFGYKIGIVVGLLTGATLYPVATFDLDQTMGLIQSERITLLPGAPAIYQSLLSAPEPRRLRPVVAAARGDRRGGRAGRPDRADARRAEDRPGGHRLRHDRGGRGHHVPRGRLGRDGRHHLRPGDPGHGDPDRGRTASCSCAATT